MELVDVVDSKSTASDGVPVRVRPPAPARRELRKFATTFYALHKKSSLTCSAAPRFKTVTASLSHSFVPPTWKLIRSVHMIHEKRAFVPQDKSSFFECSVPDGTGSGAARREGASQRSICRSVWHASRHIVQSTILHSSSAAPSHRALRDPSLCAMRKPSRLLRRDIFRAEEEPSPQGGGSWLDGKLF